MSPLASAGAKALAALLLAALLFAGWQQLAIGRLERRLAEARGAHLAEVLAHRQTKDEYRAGQARAAALENARLEAVTRQQKEATDAITADYRQRLAGLAAAFERLRVGAGPAAGAGGAASAEPVPGLPPSAGGAAGAAGDGLPDDLAWRLTAARQALQLEALIAWTRAQAAIDPNRQPENAQ